MVYETDQELNEEELHAAGKAPAGCAAPIVGPLPPHVVMTQRAAADLRACLDEAALIGYRLFHCPHHELCDIERCLDQLGEPDARWEALPPLVRGGEGIFTLTHDDESSKIWEAGVLRLAEHEVVLARWYWVDIDNRGQVRVLWLAASPSAETFHKLRREVARHRRTNASSFWQIVRGYANDDGPRIPRAAPADLFLSDVIRRRVDRELIGFFAGDVARLYQRLGVPYRRGVLLYGPPGNGKTSLIRHIGHQLPNVPAMLLRPSANFDSDDLEEVIRRWTRQAPAILVIEDLNWLLKEVNVSTFLNLLDGVEGAVTGGLLLIATSNHPEQLDPAINNRPGRFDLAIEIPSPDRELRAAFLRHKLPELSTQMVDRVAGDTHGLSFAHLQEILHLSGLQAIHSGREAHAEEDVLSAARTVIQAHRHAADGFPLKCEMPFGLLPLHQRRDG